ncbi:DUF805 domain-containing protein [Salinibacterium sp. TMP30]|uniref:DUF805 domain-containing protein n=1 Tax=Salinibacterium sp. TMP30 TaxID=3138237 RepID=UPI003138A1BB
MTIHAAPVTSPLPGVSLRVSMRRFFDRAFSLRGRASISEYWWWMLVNVLALTITQLVIPAIILGRNFQATITVSPFGSWALAPIELFTWNSQGAVDSPAVAVLSIIGGGWVLATAIPGFTVAVRRLHDSNLSGWWVLLALTPPGPIILFFLAARRPRIEGVRFD